MTLHLINRHVQELGTGHGSEAEMPVSDQTGAYHGQGLDLHLKQHTNKENYSRRLSPNPETDIDGGGGGGGRVIALITANTLPQKPMFFLLPEPLES